MPTDHPYYTYLNKICLLLLLPLLSCEKFEYSPYQIRLDDDQKNINKHNIEKIEALDISPDDTLRFILTADPQGFYEENKKMVAHINRNTKSDFLLMGGDITDFGLVKEFILVHDDFKKLKMPYVAVVGNHDAINNGKEAFQAMYGDFDISFVVANKKFILLNTNYLEFDKQVPNLEWLESELQDAENYDHVFVISHIPPSNREFGKEKAEIYERLVEQYNVSFSLHGHNHSFKYYTPENSTVPHLIAGATEDLEYIVFTVIGDKVTFERVII